MHENQLEEFCRVDMYKNNVKNTTSYHTKNIINSDIISKSNNITIVYIVI